MPKNPNRVAAGKRVASHSIPKVCPQCSVSFLGTNKQRYCSRACKEAAECANRSPRPCRQCGGAIAPAGKMGRVPVYCSEVCKSRAQYPQTARPCEVCGVVFTPPRRQGKRKVCSPQCRTVAMSAAKLARRTGTPTQQLIRLTTELEKRSGNNDAR